MPAAIGADEVFSTDTWFTRPETFNWQYRTASLDPQHRTSYVAAIGAAIGRIAEF